jgi:small GTP-binding protein
LVDFYLYELPQTGHISHDLRTVSRISATTDMDKTVLRDDSIDSDEEDIPASVNNNRGHQIKVLVIGAANSGKTTLIQKYLTGVAPAPSTTLCLDVSKASMQVEVNDLQHHITFFIYDMAGMPKFQKHNASYYSDVFAVLFVFDTTSKISLDYTIDWLSHYSDYCAKEHIYPEERILVCNKCDLQNQVMDTEPLYELAKEVGMTSLFETSALSGRNVDTMFSYIATQYISLTLGVPD